MNTLSAHRTITFFLFTCSLFFLIFSNSVLASQENIHLTIPAEALKTSVQQALPIRLSSEQTDLEGDILLTSLDSLNIHGNLIRMHGMVHGNNLAMNTMIAGQNIRLKLGQIQMPVTCDLAFRLSPQERILYVTPQFTSAQKSTNGQAAALDPLLGSLSNKEYSIPTEHFNLFNLQIGGQQVPLAMDPVYLAGTDNRLDIELKPRPRK